MAAYRPWGLLNWVIPLSPNVPWSLIGCLGTEQRCLAAWKMLHGSKKLHRVHLLQIGTPPSRRSAEVTRMEGERIAEFLAAGGTHECIKPHDLVEPPWKIVEAVDQFLAVANRNIVFDISSFPPRFFFPILRLLLKKAGLVSNLIVTYTVPADYTTEKLAENFDDWDHLPLFGGADTAPPSMFIVNVGFESFGLQEQIEHSEAGSPIKLLVPFPSAPQSAQRAIELVRKLQKHRSPEMFQLYRTDAREIGDAFDRIVSLTNGGQRKAILAPFGPKPISVGMCIFATLTESPVYYTQPTSYNPNYSRGVAKVNGTDAVYAYCIRLEGREFFTTR